MLGILLSLLSAATFAFNNASARRGVLSGSAMQSLAITVPIGVPLFFIAALASGNIGRLADFSLRGLGFLSLAGLLHFIFGRYCNVRASKAIGLTLSAPIVQLNLIVTLILAVFVLGERLTPLRMMGIVLIIIGAALMRQRESKPVEAATASAAPDGTEAFRPHYAEGYLFALLCAAGYGTTPILVRSAIGGGGPGTAIAAGVVSYGAATVLLAILHAADQWLAARARHQAGRAEVVHLVGGVRLRLADADLHGVFAGAAVGGGADPAIVAAVSLFVCLHADARARNLRQAG